MKHLLLCMVLLCAVSAVSAQTQFTATLTGDQETPPVSTPASGTGLAILNQAEDTLNVTLTFQDLVAPQTVAHIHGPAAPGVPASPVIDLPLGQISAMDFPITPQEVEWLKAGLLYFNVHSETYPNGEIRGQIIPEPSTLALLAMGVAVAIRRRIARR